MAVSRRVEVEVVEVVAQVVVEVVPVVEVAPGEVELSRVDPLGGWLFAPLGANVRFLRQSEPCLLEQTVAPWVSRPPRSLPLPLPTVCPCPLPGG